MVVMILDEGLGIYPWKPNYKKKRIALWNQKGWIFL